MDPYSHTPDFAGAQQPGMTGQVKEDFIARVGEMGVSVSAGEIHFVEELMTSDEFLETPERFRYWNVQGTEETLDLDAGTLGLTYCQVPVVLHRGGRPHVRVTCVDGTLRLIDGGALNKTISKDIFDRTGIIQRLDIFLGDSPEKRETNSEFEGSAS
jgi:hypothetical protein